MDNFIKPMETPAVARTNNRAGLILLIVFFAVVLGVGTGFGLVKYRSVRGAVGEKVKTATEVGVNDAKTFKDSAAGKLAKGGVDGEGTHHLVRVGGSSQTVYLTSSVVDLDQFVGKKVKVFGQTFAAQNAGWLMDVGKVEVLQ
jgi:hypothetical protein